LALHRHVPVATGVLINAGYRKNNVRPEGWTFVCRAELFVCPCGKKYAKPCGSNYPHLVEIEGMDQYDHAAHN